MTGISRILHERDAPSAVGRLGHPALKVFDQTIGRVVIVAQAEHRHGGADQVRGRQDLHPFVSMCRPV
jgi:hypothetical protein